MEYSYRWEISLRYPCLTMSKLPIFVSATIVLFFAGLPTWANPQNVVPEVTTPKDAQESGSIDENLVLSEPQPITGTPHAPAPEYYPYRQQLTFRAGKVAAPSMKKLDDLVLGFQYLFPKFLSPKLEAGADLHPDGKGHIHAGVRWIYHERSYFRPSVKAAFDHFVDADEKLATLTQLEHYIARLGATLEYVVWNPFSIRLEAELLINHEDNQLIYTVGLSRGW